MAAVRVRGWFDAGTCFLGGAPLRGFQCAFRLRLICGGISLVQTPASRGLERSKSGGDQEAEAAPADAENGNQSALIQIPIPEAGLKGPFVKRSRSP